NGLTLLAAYTWSHSIDDFSSPNANALGGQNVRDLRSERASSDFDTRHRLTAGYVYWLPFGRSRNFLKNLPGPANAILSGWRLSGVTTLQPGNPINVAIQGPSRSGTGTTNLDRPD